MAACEVFCEIRSLGLGVGGKCLLNWERFSEVVRGTKF